MAHGNQPPRSRPGGGPRVTTSEPVGQVLLLDADGALDDVVAPLERAVHHALAEEPRGVVCDLSHVRELATTGALRALAATGAQPRDWPSVPVAVVLSDPQARDALRAEPLGEYLIVAGSRRLALEQVMGAQAATSRSLQLAPHPTAPRASRHFVSDVLQDEGLEGYVGVASLVVSELVTNAVLHARTPIALTLAMSTDRCRIGVRDLDAQLPRQPATPGVLHGRGLALVEALSVAYGVLPAAGGGKVVWAVLADSLDASPLPRPSPRVAV